MKELVEVATTSWFGACYMPVHTWICYRSHCFKRLLHIDISTRVAGKGLVCWCLMQIVLIQKTPFKRSILKSFSLFGHISMVGNRHTNQVHNPRCACAPKVIIVFSYTYFKPVHFVFSTSDSNLLCKFASAWAMPKINFTPSYCQSLSFAINICQVMHLHPIHRRQ